DLLDLLGEIEVLVGDALGGVVLEPHLDPGIGGGDVGMVPGRLGEMADAVDHHQCALPAIGAELPPDPAILEIPVRQLLLEPLLDLCIAIGAFGRCHQTCLLKQWALPRNRNHIERLAPDQWRPFPHPRPAPPKSAFPCVLPSPRPRGFISAFSTRADEASARSARSAFRSTGLARAFRSSGRRTLASPVPSTGAPRATSRRSRQAAA